MGNPTGFLDLDRKEPGYRPKEVRLADFRAVENTPDEDIIYEQAARCMDCGIPFCHGYGCPVSNVIPEFNEFVYSGDWELALEVLLSTNNFPEFTGRICPATCETACVAGINTDPVTIRQIELAIVEKGFESGLIRPVPPKRYHDRTVAVIGSGPAGLAAADTLNRAGFKTTVFDEAEKPGGLLRYGIPDFKLEKKIVDRRIALMTEEGVVFESGIRVGTDVSARYLRKHFDAVCLACGAREPRDLKIPGRDLTGIFFALEYLTQQNQATGGETIDPGSGVTAKDKSVVVIGGGYTGSDCLGTSLRQGAKSVIQLEILPEPPVDRPDSTPWPMWPDTLFKTHAHDEGGIRKWAVTTKEFQGKSQTVQTLKCASVEWEEKDGRSMPAEVKGSEFDVKADLVILAMGYTGPGNSKLTSDFQVKLDERGNVWADENAMTSVQGIFTAGDMSTGQSLVVKAIDGGRKAAEGIMRYLTGA